MTRVLSGQEIAAQLHQAFPEAVVESKGDSVWVTPEALGQVARHLKETKGLEFDFLTGVSGVDYLDYFEVVYHLTSISNNHMTVLKTRCYDRENPAVPSVVGLWQGADLQEREIYDLMGIRFEGHPNMKRVMLWEGFQGHPLRKDFFERPNPAVEASP